VPELIFEALIAVSATPLPETEVNVPVVPVITLPAKEPLESRKTMVEAPLEADPVVRALAIVPLEILEALIAVKATPLPDTEVKVPVVAVTTFPAKEPFESLATMVDAPFAEAAVVRAFAMVPALILDALIAVMVNPDPIKFVAVTLPAVE
jgi:hypothetical protein